MVNHLDDGHSLIRSLETRPVAGSFPLFEKSTCRQGFHIKIHFKEKLTVLLSSLPNSIMTKHRGMISDPNKKAITSGSSVCEERTKTNKDRIYELRIRRGCPKNVKLDGRRYMV